MAKTLWILVLIITSTFTALGQRLSTVTIPKDDLNKVIATYRSAPPESFVHDWMRKLPPAATSDASAHPEIIRNLPSEIAKLRVDDKELEEAITQVLGPILAQYDRGRSYQIIVVKHPTPSILFDSIATLVITTGLLDRINSDDAFLGAVGHEIAHELNAKRLRDLRQQYQTVLASSDSTVALNSVLIRLAEVELDCDAFAAITLAVIGRNPAEFASLLQNIAKEFHEELALVHPSVQIRASLITSIVPQESLQVKPQVTKQLAAMKSLVARIHQHFNSKEKLKRRTDHTQDSR
jgi:hypothetical protein